MIARACRATTQDAASGITYHSLCARLTAVYTEKEFRRNAQQTQVTPKL
jgi:hypothetical protein